MKSKILSIIVLVFFVSILQQSCKKDRTTVLINKQPVKIDSPAVNKPTSFYVNSKAIFQKFAPKAQNFNFNIDLGFTVTGSSGSWFYFRPSSLLHQNNTVVTGDVDITLIEYRTKADMIFSGVTTTSGNELLESGGMFYLMIKQNGEELKMKPGKAVTMGVVQTNDNVNPMDFWRGVVNDKDTLNRIDWQIADTLAIVPRVDSQQKTLRYNFNLNYFQFGFCNLDRYWDQFKTRVNKFKITPPSSCNDTNSAALIMMKQYNACGHCYWNIDDQNIGTHYTMPVGEEIKVLIYRKTGTGEDDLEYALVNYTLVADSEVIYNGAMTACTLSQLENIIKNM